MVSRLENAPRAFCSCSAAAMPATLSEFWLRTEFILRRVVPVDPPASNAPFLTT